jgi:hypothetical protein
MARLFSVALVCAAACAVTACNGREAVPAANGAAGALSAAPHYALSRSASPDLQPAYHVLYHNGPVAVTPKIYLIFWAYKKYGDAYHVQKLLEEYTKVMGGSGYVNITTQYYELSGSDMVFITNPNNQFGGSWSDESPISKSPTDAQVAKEAIKGVRHFGYDPNALYVVATPHDHTSPGFGTHWCAYHASTTYRGEAVAYSNLPYMPDAGSNCGANIISPPSDEGGKVEGVTIMAGHEYAEGYTDLAPFSGWNGQVGEIADVCAWHNMQNDPFRKKSYTSQPLLSNATGQCEHSYP